MLKSWLMEVEDAWNATTEEGDVNAPTDEGDVNATTDEGDVYAISIAGDAHRNNCYRRHSCEVQAPFFQGGGGPSSSDVQASGVRGQTPAFWAPLIFSGPAELQSSCLSGLVMCILVLGISSLAFHLGQFQL